MRRILNIAKRVDVVYGPLVDAQEFPKGVDVTLVEGAVSSQDDLEKVQTIRQRSKLLVALGDCAVTGNVRPCAISTRRASCCSAFTWKARDANRGVPTHGVPALLRAGACRCTNSSRWTCICRAARPPRASWPCSRSWWQARMPDLGSQGEVRIRKPS